VLEDLTKTNTPCLKRTALQAIGFKTAKSAPLKRARAKVLKKKSIDSNAKKDDEENIK